MRTTNLGFPNSYGLKIKTAVEGFWQGTKSLSNIENAGTQVQIFNDSAQKNLDLKPVWDFDIYDRLLKTAVLFGIVPQRFGTSEEVQNDLAKYLTIPRGTAHATASPMVKWFNTNYHVIQPEIEQDPHLGSSQLPKLNSDQKLALIGPWTLLSYAINKTTQSKSELFQKLAAEYQKCLNQFSPDSMIQLEEPAFITHGLPEGYNDFLKNLQPQIHLHVYFESVTKFATELFRLEVAAFGLDFIDGPGNIELLRHFPSDKILIAGIINGRNVWPASTRTQKLLAEIQKHIPDERLFISPSCSLQHVPLSAVGEKHDFAFAIEKIAELEKIKNGTIHYRQIGSAETALPEERYHRSRQTLWVSETPYPTSTIGSFPQTPELRQLRKKWQNRQITDHQYETEIKYYIADCIRRQEELGLDILVHGEFERPDMVQYFAEQLEGMTSIQGWVQSYGTRYIRPPVIIGHISRPTPMTVKWSSYAQSLTKRPVKGMLTGPVTLVQWSYPREDISHEAQFYDIARALQTEVNDLVAAGITHIQIDEPAIREGLPLNPEHRNHYLHHATNSFRLTYSEVPDNIVIYSHICFSEFSDILDAIQDLGVDVLSIEDSRSKGKVARNIRDSGFRGSIGLGVFDVHSPRIPQVEEILEIPRSLNLDRRHVWINPDCGLKTRGQEAYQQLSQMMKAVKILRNT